MTFAVDMDGVLCDWDGGIRNLIEKHLPHVPVIPPHKRVNFYASDDYPEELRPSIKALAFTPGFYRGLKPLPYAVEGIKRLRTYGPVIILTAPTSGHNTCAQEKLEWVTQHLGVGWFDSVVVAKDKTRVKAHYLIDDKPRVTGEDIPRWEHLVFDALYNRHIVGNRRVTWNSFEAILGAPYVVTRPPFPVCQDQVFVVRKGGTVLNKLYTFNGNAWHRADGAYKSRSKKTPGTVDPWGFDSWRDATGILNYCARKGQPRPTCKELWGLLPTYDR